jgi:DNA polymerase-3 subunit gamma/tau
VLGTAGVPGGGAGYADGYSSHSGGYPIPAGPGTAGGRGGNGYGHHDGHSGGYSREELGVAPPPPVPSFPSSSAPAGNPYGSYVNEDTGSYISTDLPGYTPSLASGYLPTPAPSSGRHRPVPAPPAPTPPAGGAYGNGYSIPPGQLPAGYTGKHKGQGGQGLPGYDRLGPLPGYPVDGPAAGLPGPQGYWPPDPYQERGWDGHDGR